MRGDFMSYISNDNYSDLKRAIMIKASNQISVCKTKLDNRKCNLEKCKHCEYGNIIENLGIDFTEDEIIYIYGLAKMKYTKGKIEELENKDRIKKEKREVAKEMGPGIAVILTLFILLMSFFIWLFANSF